MSPPRRRPPKLPPDKCEACGEPDPGTLVREAGRVLCAACWLKLRREHREQTVDRERERRGRDS